MLKENETTDLLPMPSDVKGKAADETPAIEPPSVKLIVRLFLIPALIVAAAVGVMFLIGSMAGSPPTFEEALAGLKGQGGQRTADWLVGPGSKQRYLYAQTLTERMKQGMSEPQRIETANKLIELLDQYVRSEEGQIQNFVLLALGRVWQGANDPSLAALESQRKVLDTLIRFASSENLAARKAAVLAMCFTAGLKDSKELLPILITKVKDPKEDLDVRMAAATAIGPIASPSDADPIEALHQAMSDTDKEHKELVWDAALSLAQLNQPDVADTILMLLSRDELNKFEVLDRERDPNNPTFRLLNDQEKLRILINTMMGAKNLKVDAVQEKLRDLAKNDPSPRVRAARAEILATKP